jgi:plastocyanin
MMNWLRAPRLPSAPLAPLAILAGLAGGLAIVAPATAADLAGRVEVVLGDKAAAGEAGRVVVYFEPAKPVPPKALPKGLEIKTEAKQFQPRVMALPKGTAVAFPNADPILHNVFSVSEPEPFDLGLLGKGPGKSVVFDRPGLVRVFCNVHPDMVAYVLVLDTPYYTTTGPDGSFLLKGVPDGPGRLTVWHEQAEPWTKELKVPAGEAVVARIALTKPRIPSHLNKQGRQYGRNSRDRYRKPPG